MEMDREFGYGAEDSMGNINDYDHDDETNGSDGDDKDSGSEDGEIAVFDLDIAHRHLADVVCSTEVTISNMLEFSKILNPSAKCDYDTVKAICLQIYEEEKVQVKSFRNMEGHISLSVDVMNHFSRSGRFYRFMCLSAHFIDDSWKPRKWVIHFPCLSEGEDCCISEVIPKTLKDWEIEDKISTFTCASFGKDEVDEVVEVVRKTQTNKKLQLNGQLFRVNCCAAMFNRMAKDAFKEISDIITKVSQLNSWKSPPLWHLTTHKLKVALEMEALGEFSSDLITNFYDVPSSDEWKKVEVVCNLTERCYSIAKVLFETKYPTVNIYHSNLQELGEYLGLESKSSCSFTSTVAKKMLGRLDKYCNNVFLLLGVAAFLDPRYKMKYIECHYSVKSDGSSEFAQVMDAIHHLYDGYVASALEKGDPTDVQDFSNSDEEKDKEKLEKSEGRETSIPSWVQEYKEFTKIDVKPLTLDLDLYMEEPVVTWRQNFSALKWWKANSPKYPILAKMARDILAIPMSVVTSDGAYCTEPRTAKLDCIGPGTDLQNALMCCRTWLFKKKVGCECDETYHVPALCGNFYW